MIPVIFVDVETQYLFDKTGTRSAEDLKISFVGAYDDEKDRFYSFWEDDLKDLGKLFLETDKIVGYNTWAFDYRVLSPYYDFDLYTLQSLDLMVAMQKTVGFRPKLDDLAKANLGAGKIGKGTDAYVYWQEGELEKLEKYCLEDVRITYEIWKLGEETSMLKYYDYKGFISETDIDWSKGILQKKEEENQLGLV